MRRTVWWQIKLVLAAKPPSSEAPPELKVEASTDADIPPEVRAPPTHGLLRL